jgi:hypothetical protein
MTSTLTELARVRGLVDNAGAAVDVYSTHLDFTVGLQVIGSGSGRTGAIVAAVVGLMSVVIGGLALARAGRIGSNSGRAGAVVALATGLIGMVLSVLHLATSTGGFGTGSGRAGAIVALVVGQIGINLGGLALARSRRAGRPGHVTGSAPVS